MSREELGRGVEVLMGYLELPAPLGDPGEALVVAAGVDEKAHVWPRRPLEAGAEVRFGVLCAAELECEPAAEVVGARAVVTGHAQGGIALQVLVDLGLKLRGPEDEHGVIGPAECAAAGEDCV